MLAIAVETILVTLFIRLFLSWPPTRDGVDLVPAHSIGEKQSLFGGALSLWRKGRMPQRVEILHPDPMSSPGHLRDRESTASALWLVPSGKAAP
jgi:hypothetical protein